MGKRELFSIVDFANFSRITKDALCHYDRIGLFHPALREKNKYRYYSSGQLAVVNLIRTFQVLGLSLLDIKELKDKRTPDDVHAMLLTQMDKIDHKIDDLINARRLLSTFQKTIYSVLDIDEDLITIKTLPAEAIILGDINKYENKSDGYDALLAFYKTQSAKYPGLDLNYPVWGTFSGERIKNGDWALPDRYYFYNPRGLERRPSAQYAIGYDRCGYGRCNSLYERIIEFIGKNGYEICGDAYEEYPLNEVSIIDDNNYLVRVMITVCKSKH